jgi:hypothetical protein
LHSAKRFAWERKNAADPNPIKLDRAHPLSIVFVAYNVIYWLPFVLALTPLIGYKAGSIGFFCIVMFRAVANLVRNNFLTLEQAEVYPFRIPA